MVWLSDVIYTDQRFEDRLANDDCRGVGRVCRNRARVERPKVQVDVVSGGARFDFGSGGGYFELETSNHIRRVQFVSSGK